VRVGVPLRTRLGRDDVSLTISSRLRDVALPLLVRSWSFSDGDLDLELRDGKLDVAGQGRVQGVPVTVDWTEGKGGDRRLELTSRPDSAEREALGLDLQPWIDGPVAVRARLLEKQGAGTLDITANLADASVSMRVLAVAKRPGTPGTASGRVVLAGGVPTDVDHLTFSAGGASVSGRAALAAGGARLPPRRLGPPLPAGPARPAPRPGPLAGPRPARAG